jgi:hypothetical protein
MASGTPFTVGGDNSHPAQGLQLIGQRLQPRGMNAIVIGK